MKSLFPGHYRPTSEQFKKLWADCIFSFDANVLLNLYRFTEESRNSLMLALTKLQPRIWLTHQAALEYHDNRYEVFLGQSRTYGELETILSDAISSIEKKFRRHPQFHDTQLSREVIENLQAVIQIIHKRRTQHPDPKLNEALQDSIASLFDGRVGLPYSAQAYDQRCSEAAKRFERKIPPGYEDDNEKTKAGHKKYGDVIIWFQLMDHAKKEKKPVLFVTDDTKDDWWVRASGKTVGPRPELIQEFLAETHSPYYMYSTSQFLRYARQNLNIAVSQETIEEAKAIRDEANVSRESMMRLIKAAARRPSMLQHLPAADREAFVELLERVGVNDNAPQIMNAFSDKDRKRILRLKLFLSDLGSVSHITGKDAEDVRQLRRLLRQFAKDAPPPPTTVPEEEKP